MPSAFGYALYKAKWAESSVPVVYTSSVPEKYKTAIGNASKTWGQAGANIAFHNSSRTTNAVNISFVDKLPPMNGEEPPSGAVAGTYNLVYGNNSSRYYSSDIRFNSKVHWGLMTDVETVALHEFGHALGLGHTQFLNYTKSIMTKEYLGTRRTLKSDDIAGLKAKYGSKTPSSWLTDSRFVSDSYPISESDSKGFEYENKISQRNFLLEQNSQDASQIVSVSLQYIPFSNEELIEQSDLIVRGTIQAALPAEWATNDGTAPKYKYVKDPYSYAMYHDVVVKVDEVFKGSADDEIVIRQTGGSVDGTAIIDMDSINYLKGDEAILYLKEGAHSTDLFPYYIAIPVQGELLVIDEECVNPYGQVVYSEYK